MKQYVIKYEFREPRRDISTANSEKEAVEQLLKKGNYARDEINILKVEQMGTYEIEYNLTAKYRLKVAAISEEHAAEILYKSYETPGDAVACSYPDIGYIKKVVEE